VRGKADAAVVDGSVVDHLSELAFADELRIVYTSTPVPPPAVVVMGAGKKHAAAVKQVLVGICDSPDGAELCKTLTLTSVKSATDKDYKALLKRYNR
jgi:ABC-type phosphate/phosphonate transport system substrate-binding protein